MIPSVMVETTGGVLERTLAGVQAAPRLVRPSRRWLPKDKYAYVVVGIVSAGVLLRMWALWPMDQQGDDVSVVYEILRSPFSLSYVFGERSGHWGPIARLIAWPLVRVAPFNYRLDSCVVLIAAVGAQIACYRLFLRLFGRGALSLALLTGLVFSVLLGPVFLQWSTALPLMLAMLVAALLYLTQLNYMQTGSRRWLWLTGLAIASGLGLDPQFVPYLWATATLCLLVPRLDLDDPRIRRRRLATLAVVYLVLISAYGAALAAFAENRVRGAPGLGSWWGVFYSAIMETFLPGLLGGPWKVESDSWTFVAPMSLPAIAAVAFLLVGAAVLLAVLKARSWQFTSLIAFNAVALVTLLSVSVTTQFSFTVFRQARYTSILLLPTLVLIGLAWRYGSTRAVWKPRVRRWFSPREQQVGLLVVAAFLTFISIVTSLRVGHEAAKNSSRPYWTTVSASLAAHPGVSIIDQLMPVNVVNAGFLNEVGLQSSALAYFVTDQKFNAPADVLWVIADDGQLRHVDVTIFRSSGFGPVLGCGYPTTAAPTTIQTGPGMFSYYYVVALDYTATAASTIDVQIDGKSFQVPVQRGAGRVSIPSSGSVERVTVSNPNAGSVGVCIAKIDVGAYR